MFVIIVNVFAKYGHIDRLISEWMGGETLGDEITCEQKNYIKKVENDQEKRNDYSEHWYVKY